MELVAALRHGDISALGILYERYQPLASTCAQRIVDPVTAEDVVSESFIKLYRITANGGGPTDTVRGYILSIVRNLAIDTLRRRREILVDSSDPAFLSLVDQTHLDGSDDDGSGTATAALATLPQRWRTVLWAMEVEGDSRHQVGGLLGLSPLAVSALAARARKGLRRSYLALRRGPGSVEHPALPAPRRDPRPRAETDNRT